MIFEYGAMSSRFSLEADNKYTAYAAMLLHYGRNNHLIALYEPEEVVKNDSWLNIFGKIAERLDEIYGGEGKFDDYFEAHQEDISKAYKTIRQIC